jgi:hypothetical protein
VVEELDLSTGKKASAQEKSENPKVNQPTTKGKDKRWAALAALNLSDDLDEEPKS